MRAVVVPVMCDRDFARNGLAMVTNQKNGGTTAEIAAAAGVDARIVRTHLSNLVKLGEAMRVRRGVYRYLTTAEKRLPKGRVRPRITH